MLSLSRVIAWSRERGLARAVEWHLLVVSWTVAEPYRTTTVAIKGQ